MVGGFLDKMRISHINGDCNELIPFFSSKLRAHLSFSYCMQKSQTIFLLLFNYSVYMTCPRKKNIFHRNCDVRRMFGDQPKETAQNGMSHMTPNFKLLFPYKHAVGTCFAALKKSIIAQGQEKVIIISTNNSFKR